MSTADSEASSGCVYVAITLLITVFSPSKLARVLVKIIVVGGLAVGATVGVTGF